ncbi:MAG: hypothetical protein MSH58_00335 [Clostridiales bacterium]|nr:hypothetical protein [Clostridiales bacterium]
MENAGSIVNEGKGQTGIAKVKTVLGKINRVINLIGLWLFRLRKLVLAAPVVYYALKLAEYNREHLPEQVGINLQATGEFAQYISRNMAVMGPLALTGGCLILMFCSRKAMYSWSISVFTLALPLLLLFSNAYPT